MIYKMQYALFVAARKGYAACLLVLCFLYEKYKKISTKRISFVIPVRRAFPSLPQILLWCVVFVCM